jgi:hypothetical protein
MYKDYLTKHNYFNIDNKKSLHKIDKYCQFHLQYQDRNPMDIFLGNQFQEDKNCKNLQECMQCML